MTKTTLHDTSEYTVVSYGNGTAYTVISKREQREIFFQGDDANLIREDLTRVPLDLNDVWTDYCELSEPINS